MNAIKVAIDSAIFFFCFKSDREDIKPINMRKLLDHLSSAPHIIPYVPISVLGESVIECIRGEKEKSDHDLSELHELIDFGVLSTLVFSTRTLLWRMPATGWLRSTRKASE